jgi:hypothetical protein
MVETENVIVVQSYLKCDAVIRSIHQLLTTQGSNHNLENMHEPTSRPKASSMVMYICVRTIHLLIFCLFTWLTHIPTNRHIENANQPKYQMKIKIVA